MLTIAMPDSSRQNGAQLERERRCRALFRWIHVIQVGGVGCRCRITIRTPRSLAGTSRSRRECERREQDHWIPIHLPVLNGYFEIAKLLPVLERGHGRT